MTARKPPATKRPTRAPPVTLTTLVATLKRMRLALHYVHQDVTTIHEHQHTIYQRIEHMDAKIQAALDAVSTKIDDAVATVSAEVTEIQALVAALPGADPTEIVAAVDAIGARLDALSTSVASISDTVLPAPPV